MRSTIDLTVCCTLDDQFRLMDLARREVEATKAREDWELFYPQTPSEAIQLLIRTAIADKLLALNAVTLHEIGHKVRDLEV